MMAGSDSSAYEILSITGTHQETVASSAPGPLVDIPVPSEKQVFKTREFLLGTQMMHGSFINGRQMTMEHDKSPDPLLVVSLR